VGLLAAPARSAPEAALPWSLQAELFKTIFTFERTLRAVDRVAVSVVYKGEATTARQVTAAMRDVGLDAQAVAVEMFRAKPGAASVVYLASERLELRALTARRKVLTISGLEYYARYGGAAVCLTKGKDDRPRIRIDLEQVRGESRFLSARLLDLTIVQITRR